MLQPHQEISLFKIVFKCQHVLSGKGCIVKLLKKLKKLSESFKLQVPPHLLMHWGHHQHQLVITEGRHHFQLKCQM